MISQSNLKLYYFKFIDLCYTNFMTTTEKYKRIFLIAIGFGLATYLIMSGMAILDKDANMSTQESSKLQ